LQSSRGDGDSLGKERKGWWSDFQNLRKKGKDLWCDGFYEDKDFLVLGSKLEKRFKLGKTNSGSLCL